MIWIPSECERNWECCTDLRANMRIIIKLRENFNKCILLRSYKTDHPLYFPKYYKEFMYMFTYIHKQFTGCFLHLWNTICYANGKTYFSRVWKQSDFWSHNPLQRVPVHTVVKEQLYIDVRNFMLSTVYFNNNLLK